MKATFVIDSFIIHEVNYESLSIEILSKKLCYNNKIKVGWLEYG